METSPEDAGKGISCATDVVLPVEVVTLKHLKTKDGRPVRVRCEAVDELVAASILERLPGGAPPSPELEPDTMSAAEKVRIMDGYGCPLIEAGTVLLRADGSEVRPGFYFDPAKRDSLSLPGRLLRVEDRTMLVTAILQLSGFLGGAALEGAEFHDEDGAGGVGGVGAVEVGEG